MSVPVELTALHERIAELGPSAFLLTTSEGDQPHVVSVVVEVDGDELVMGMGRRSGANLAARPKGTLLWPAPAGADHCLLVDAVPVAGDRAGGVDHADRPDDRTALRPVSAVLHRMAGRPGDGPNCLPVE